MFALIRLRIDQDDPKEIAWAKGKFAATKIRPLEDFLAGREFVANDHQVFDVSKLAGNPMRPFAIINYMLAENPPPQSEQVLMQGFKTVNIGPGMDLSKNSPETNRGLARAARDGLRALLTEAHARSADTVLLVQADEGVAHGKVVGVMNLARTLGLTRLAIATRAEAER